MIEEDYNRQKHDAANMALRMLNRRIHTAHDLREKMLQKGISEDILADVIAECERRGYLNDKLAAQCYFDEYRRKCCGPRYIRLAMKKRGLSTELIDQIFSENNSVYEEIEAARCSVRKKKNDLEREKNSLKRREKIFRYLYSRGFSQDIISEIIREN